MTKPAAPPSVAETIADWLAASRAAAPPASTVEMCRKLFLDVAGLCVSARNEDYVGATLGAADTGVCTAIGHAGGFDAFSAALINGTAAHGEDYDDTFEGGPVHSGAVIIPAVMAICEREGLGGDRFLLGVATGCELLCRLSLVTPKAIHAAGFHPTAVFGCMAASAAVAAALGLDRDKTVSAMGIAGSMASGIIEYLAEGAWTKRMHAGWAAQSGIRAALMARGGFLGPRTVYEGSHGFYKAFAPSVKPDYAPLLDGLGAKWLIDDIAFKPYACGTMTQPFIDCAIALAARGVKADDIGDILCRVGEGTVHRLWEPLAVKHNPRTPYHAKFSTPFCMAIGFLDGKAGLAQFTEARIADPAARALAAKIRFEINPDDPYPKNFIGHLRATLKSGETLEIHQPHMRGGAHAPLSTAEVETKCVDNAIHGGWPRDKAAALKAFSGRVFASRDLAGLAEFRS
jgi:2-methylcitrate dehydratase PrpD